MKFLFFSAESEPPAGSILMQMMNPVQIEFNERHCGIEYTEELDDITIVFICTSEQLVNEGFYPERKYVTLKKRYADYRMHINYSNFIKADKTDRYRLCLEVIDLAIKDIGRKVKSFNWEKLLKDIRTVIEEKNGMPDDSVKIKRQVNVYNKEPDIEVVFNFNGQKKGLICDGYRPAHMVSPGCVAAGIHHFYGTSEVHSDGTAEGTITFISPEYYPNSMWEGKKIIIRERDMTVGEAIVTKIYNPILRNHNNASDQGKTSKDLG